jgi:hypothetical protein
MSELQKYDQDRPPFCDGCGMRQAEDGDWCRSEDVDARLALIQQDIDAHRVAGIQAQRTTLALESEVALMQRAIEWCLDTGATGVYYPKDGSRSVVNRDDLEIEVPAEFTEIIKPREA